VLLIFLCFIPIPSEVLEADEDVFLFDILDNDKSIPMSFLSIFGASLEVLIPHASLVFFVCDGQLPLFKDLECLLRLGELLLYS
jgi:hypothetical protein